MFAAVTNDDKSSNGFGASSNLDQINFDFIDDYKSPAKSNEEGDEEDEEVDDESLNQDLPY